MIKNIFCPNCQTQIQVNDEKEFCFCLQCGNKIILKSETAPISNVENDTNAFIEKKLEEVKFYYDLSKSKNEHLNFQKEPIYYLKAQDILVDLSESYPDEYKIWWELSKPIDFGNPLVGSEVAESYIINEDYFNKALDRAEIDQKKN